MKSVKNFIKALGENYYLEFLVDPYSNSVEYDKHFVLVEYQNKNYYENNLEFITVRQQEILNDLKKQYENALSQIFLKLATTNSDTFDSFLKFNIEAVKIIYDPSKITYSELLDIYWRQINPTQKNGQFGDHGPQYRSAIFYQNEKNRIGLRGDQSCSIQ